MENLQILTQCSLFKEIPEQGIEQLLSCLGARHAIFKKGDVIIPQGSHPTEAGIVLSGGIQGARLGYQGSLQVVSNLSAGDLFGDALICTPDYPSPVTVSVTSPEASVVLLRCDRLLTGCSQACDCHNRLRINLMQVIAGKFWALNQKLFYLSVGSLRGRIAAYLLDTAGERSTFTIPFSRADMAGYLGADRSALSRELSRMRDAGMLEYYRSSFKILDFQRLRDAAGE